MIQQTNLLNLKQKTGLRKMINHEECIMSVSKLNFKLRQ